MHMCACNICGQGYVPRSHVTERSAKNTIIIQMQLHEEVEIAATVHLHNSTQMAMQEGRKYMQTYASMSYSFRLKPRILQALVALPSHSTPGRC
jgi:uncharacterized OB-fold protein